MHKDYLCCQTQASVITSKLDEGDYSLIKLIPEKQIGSGRSHMFSPFSPKPLRWESLKECQKKKQLSLVHSVLILATLEMIHIHTSSEQ